MPEARLTEWAGWVEWKEWICNAGSELPFLGRSKPRLGGAFCFLVPKALRRPLSRSGYKGLDDLTHCLLASRAGCAGGHENTLDNLTSVLRGFFPKNEEDSYGKSD